jgi:4-hydroxy-tetrahydrodipicolinate reductase
MVDFTPGRGVENVRAAIEAGVPCVVGTTGGTRRGRGRARRVPVFYAPNFAIGAVLMMRFAGEASRHLDRAEIVELHHATKLDAPSGTALATAARMAATCRSTRCGCPGSSPTRRCCSAAPGSC